MKFSVLLTPLLLWAACIAVFAQQPSTPSAEPLPKLPLMAGVGADAEWLVTYTSKSHTKGRETSEEVRNRKMRQQYSPLVLEKRVLKANGQMVIYTTYEAGLKSEAWIVGNYIYALPLREGEGIHIDTKADGDFPEIDWVSSANFRGSVKQKKRRVYVYETTAPNSSNISTPTPVGSAAKTLHCRVYIDQETRLPIMAENDGATWTYRYFGAPSALPAMDERIAKQLRSATE